MAVSEKKMVKYPISKANVLPDGIFAVSSSIKNYCVIAHLTSEKFYSMNFTIISMVQNTKFLFKKNLLGCNIFNN